MRPRDALAETVAGLSAQHVIGRRTIDPAVPFPFTATMRNDFMTPRGTPYKWQDLRGTLIRTVSSGATPTLALARYTWQDVSARTGTGPSPAPRPFGPTPLGAAPDRPPWVDWTFARGQGFSTILLHSDVSGGYVADVDQPGWGMTDVRYPDLPKSPAVDLLLMLSWDVVLFEVLCTHLGTATSLGRTGVTVDLDRHSGTGGALQFSNPATASFFRNSQMFAVKHGYCVRDGRTTGIYAFHCLDCELTTRAGPTVQRGRSSYWGTVHIDLLTGDLLAGEFTEVIVGTYADATGKELPIHRRRLVRMRAGTPVADAPAAATVVPPAARLVDPELVAAAERQAMEVETRVRTHLSSLQYVPEEVKPLADVGFRSIVGTDYGGTLDSLSALRAGLGAWVAGDPAVHSLLASHLRILEGLLAYCKVSVDEAVRLGPAAMYVDALEQVMGGLRDELAALVVLLERLEEVEFE